MEDLKNAWVASTSSPRAHNQAQDHLRHEGRTTPRPRKCNPRANPPDTEFAAAPPAALRSKEGAEQSHVRANGYGRASCSTELQATYRKPKEAPRKEGDFATTRAYDDVLNSRGMPNPASLQPPLAFRESYSTELER